MIKLLFKAQLFYLRKRFSLEQFENLLIHSFWSVFGNLLSRGSMIVSTILLARILDNTEYGKLGILRSTLNFFVVFAAFGLGNTTSRYISLNRKENLQEARRIFDLAVIFNSMLAVLVSLSVFVFSKQIATWSFNDLSLYKQIRISSFILFFAAINGVLAGSLSGFQDFKTIAKNNFYAACVQVILSITGAYFFGISGALTGYGLGYVYLYFLHQKAIKMHFGRQSSVIHFNGFLKAEKAFLWTFSLPAALSSFLVAPVFWWTKAFLIRKSNFMEMAFFDVADQWRLIVLFVPTALIQIVLPALTNSNEEDFKKTLNFTIKINLFFTLLSMLPVLFLSRYIMLLYGEEFINIQLFIVTVASALFSCFSSIIGQAIASKDKMWTGFAFNFFWAVFFIAFAYHFINLGYKATGLAFALLLSYMIHGISQFVYFKIKFKNE